MLVAFSTSLFAQKDKKFIAEKQGEPEYIQYLIKHDKVMDQSSGSSPDKGVTESKGMQKISFASSANIYSLISTDQSALTAVQDHQSIVFFSRAGGAFGGSGHDLRISSTSNMGGTWDEYIVDSDGTNLFRYPSGGILNFPGASSLDDCYAAFSGPITDGSGWKSNFHGSIKMDGTMEEVIYESLPSNTYFAHANADLHVLDDSTAHVAGDNYVGNETDYSWNNGLLVNGSYNPATNKFEWDSVIEMHHSFALNVDGDPAGSGARMAWSQDGSVGYYVFRGRDSVNDPRAYQPVIYKSTDKGQTWNQEPFFNFSSLDSITNYLWPTLGNQNLTKAFFSYQYDMTVDHEGMLHIFTLIQGSFSDHNDSLGYTFTNEPNKLFHVYMTPGGGWEAEFIKEFATKSVTGDDQQFGIGADAMGWTHRINASRTEDGEKVFVVWSDTDTNLVNIQTAGTGVYYINAAPDIFAWGKDLTDNTYYPVTDFTSGTQFYADNFFHYASDITLKDADGNFVIPVTTADKGSDPLKEVTHELLLTVGFGPTVGIDDHIGDDHFTVSQNFPNPFHDRTNIAVELKKSAELSLKVYNMIGQEVHTENKGKRNAGAHNFRIAAEKLTPGVYFYEIRAGEATVTKKMIVQ
ncbi:MAG: T9SS type A sorting domain-containing protein [Bacteroidales bacterium]